ncbi:hypothetical protein [Ekhidna sp.]
MRLKAEFELIAYLNQYREDGIEFKFYDKSEHQINEAEGFPETARVESYKSDENVDAALIKRFIDRRWQERKLLNFYKDFVLEEIELIQRLHQELKEHGLAADYEWKYKPVLKFLKEEITANTRKVEESKGRRTAFEVALIQFYSGKLIDLNKGSEFYFEKVAQELNGPSSRRLYQTYLDVLDKGLRTIASFKNDKLNHYANRNRLKEFNRVIDFLSQSSVNTLKATEDRDEFQRNAKL